MKHHFESAVPFLKSHVYKLAIVFCLNACFVRMSEWLFQTSLIFPNLKFFLIVLWQVLNLYIQNLILLRSRLILLCFIYLVIIMVNVFFIRMFYYNTRYIKYYSGGWIAELVDLQMAVTAFYCFLLQIYIRPLTINI